MNENEGGGVTEGPRRSRPCRTRARRSTACCRRTCRVRSHCHVVRLSILFTPDSLRDSMPLFLKRQCDRALAAPPERAGVARVDPLGPRDPRLSHRAHSPGYESGVAAEWGAR
jgi:hypothetical protein